MQTCCSYLKYIPESKFVKSKKSQSLKAKQREKFLYLEYWGAKYGKYVYNPMT